MTPDPDRSLALIEALARRGQARACVAEVQRAFPLANGLPDVAALTRLVPVLVDLDPLPGNGASRELLVHLAQVAAGPRRNHPGVKQWVGSPEQWAELMELRDLANDLSPLGMNAVAIGVLGGQVARARRMLTNRKDAAPEAARADYEVLKRGQRLMRQYAAWSRVKERDWKTTAFLVLVAIFLGALAVFVWQTEASP